MNLEPLFVKMSEIECMDFLIVQKFLGTLRKYPDTNKADLVDQLLANRARMEVEALMNEYEN